ncbi:MAG: LCP family protein, partial [Actinomycetota bacterium]|nr:LCP family protein [Actinomycetota bacterium]
MNRQTGIALFAALISGLAAAVILIAVMSSPSEAVPDVSLDADAVSAAVLDAAFTLFPAAAPGTPPPSSADGVGAFDPDTATWHLRTRAGDPTVFTFGAPGSIPLMGDWNGDGFDTVGTYDPETATVTLRNTNSAGEADLLYTLGLSGDIPIAGNFDGDDTDTVSVFRPSDGFVYVYNTSGSDIGEPVATYTPANSAGYLFAADFNGDGTDTIGSWESATGTVAISTAAGALDSEFTFAAAGTRFFVGDWTGDGTDTPGSFDPATATVHLRYENTDGGPDETYPWGTSSWLPVAGHFGDLTSAVTVEVNGAPPSLEWAVESLYLELGDAPHFDGEASGQFTSASVTEDLAVEGIATTAAAYGGQVAVVTTDTDTILAVSDDGWTWSVVGGTLPSRGFSAASTSPRFVTIIGSDWSVFNGVPPTDPTKTFADSIHIYAVNAAGDKGAIVGIPRDTAMPSDGPLSFEGWEKINNTMRDQGPQVPTAVLANETGLPIEGYFTTSFGSRITGFPGFEDIIDEMGGIDFLVPYSVPSQCVSDPPPTATATVGDIHIDGRGSLSLSRERKCIPPIVYSGNTLRTATQGILMKAAVAEVQKLGIAALPSLLDIMDDYVTTDLSYEDVLTLAETLFNIYPGEMPTLTPSDIDKYGYDAYNFNPGDLPNVVVDGCWGFLDDNPFTQYHVSGNYGTFADLADGVLDTYPIYEYNSGDPASPFACPWLLDSTVTRLAGSNRYATAAEISKSKFSPGAPVAYVATGLNFPD